MPDVPLPTQSEREFLDQVCSFASRKAQNGCYLVTMHPKSLNAPVLFFFAIGDQALAVQKLLLDNQAKQDSLIEVVPSLDNMDLKKF